MTEEISGWFAEFVETKLARYGFRIVAPWLAERRENGVRQGIMWSEPKEEDGEFARVTVRTFRSFDHELDDGPGGRIKPHGLQPACAQLSGELGRTGVCTRQSLVQNLRLMSEIELEAINEPLTAVSILRCLKAQPNKANLFLGTDERVARFNYAYCHERAGQLEKAVELYRDFAKSVEADESPVARDYWRVALKRAEMLHTLDRLYSLFAQSDDPTLRAFVSAAEVLYRPTA